MKQVELIHKINNLFSIFVTQVKGLNSLNLYDINIISEDVLIPIFKEVFQLPRLINVNDGQKNYPGIDLADDDSKVAFQVSATKSSKKVNDTLHQFFKYNLEDRYDRLYCYILTEKQSSYSINSDDLEGLNFDFSPERDILDFTDLLKRIQRLEIEKINKILSILEKQFPVFEKLQSSRRDSGMDDVAESQNTNIIDSEILYSNLLKISFPKKIYIAQLDFIRNEVIKASRCEGGSYLKNKASLRQVAREALYQKGFTFANDWVCHENKIITFHDLNDDSNPLLRIIDEGTVEDFDTEDFYLIDSDHENVFKGLLHLCLQRYLYQKNVEWKHEDRLFVFMPEEEVLCKREITWRNKKTATRTVVEIYFKENKGEIFYCKHLAFKTFYRRYNGQWFIEIVPTWYISYDGYKKSIYGYEKIKWLKKVERNPHVFNHLRFIVQFLKKTEKQLDLFEEVKQPMGFLEIHDLETFAGHTAIPDDDWNSNDDKGMPESEENIFLEN